MSNNNPFESNSADFLNWIDTLKPAEPAPKKVFVEENNESRETIASIPAAEPVKEDSKDIAAIKEKSEKEIDLQREVDMVDSVLSDSDWYESAWMKPLIKNQFRFFEDVKSQKGMGQSTSTIDTLKGVVVKALKGMAPLHDLMGIQPMEGPIGLSFGLEFSHEDSEPTTFDDTSEDLAAPTERRLRLEVAKYPVEAMTRKLQAAWTAEAMQDIKAYHGLDIEQEIMTALGQEIAHEVIAEQIHNIKNIATEYKARSDNTSDDMLMVEVNYVANEIARKTRRGAGNYIIVSNEMLDRLVAKEVKDKARYEALHDDKPYKPSLALVDTKDRSAVLSFAGTWNGVFRIFVYAHQPKNEILVGYKGTGDIDAGLFYCPYIMVMSGGMVVDPVSFQPTMRMMTRYGARASKNAKDYYGKLIV